MAHFAKLDDNNVVLEVHAVDDKDCLKNGVEDEATGIAYLQKVHGKDTKWAQTSYSGKIRKQYAFMGATLDKTLDMFVTKAPYESWALDVKGDWQAPVEKPKTEEPVVWNEKEQTWDVVEVLK